MAKLSTPVATLGVLVFGTAASLLAKLIYSVQAVNSHGDVAPFTKPWFQVLGMFMGMSICILLDLPKKSEGKSGGGDSESTALLAAADAAAVDPDEPVTPVWIINVPTVFDLFATACGTTGLLYTTVSVYQMLRGAQLVFTALLSIAFLGRRLSALNYGGIGLCIAGIVLVGVANVWGEDGAKSQSDTLFGILVILAGQVLQAAQVVVEEHLLQNLQMPSVRIVAYEGMFGVLHCLAWVFPIVFFLPGTDAGHLEDPFDALYMVFHNWQVAAVILLDMALMLAYNVCGMEVTNNLSAVSRVIIETLRTLLVWLCNIILFYLISGRRLGEPWTKYSFIQALGFGLTVLGTVCYNFEQLSADYRRRGHRGIAKKTATAGDTSGSSNAPGHAVLDSEASPLSGQKAGAIALGDVSKVSPSSKAGGASKKMSKKMSDEEGGYSAMARPLVIDEDDDGSEEGDDLMDGNHVGSFVGSASHGSFLASSPLASSFR